MPGGRNTAFWSLACSHRADISTPLASRTAQRTVVFDVDHHTVRTCELRRAEDGYYGVRTPPTVAPPCHEASGTCEGEIRERARLSHLLEVGVMPLRRPEASMPSPASARARAGLP